MKLYYNVIVEETVNFTSECFLVQLTAFTLNQHVIDFFSSIQLLFQWLLPHIFSSFNNTHVLTVNDRSSVYVITCILLPRFKKQLKKNKDISVQNISR